MAGGIAFIDESGDLGRRPGKGSSAAFVRAMVIFADKVEAERCRQLIDALRAELGKAPGHEFHFTSDGHATRLAFLGAVRDFDFRYFTVSHLKGKRGSPTPQDLFRLACARLLAGTQEKIAGGRVILDGSGDHMSRKRLATAIRKDASDLHVGIKIQPSETDNLLQIADYVAGIVRKTVEDQIRAEIYHRLLRRRRAGEFEL